MAQHDFNIANQSFPSFRTDLNNALSAINTSQSGTSRPSGAVAGTIWLDTTSATTPTLKYYDGADDISLATLDHSANTVNWLDSTVSITGLSTTATGTVLTLTDSASTSTVNLIIDNQKEVRFRETTANGTNYIGLKAPASVTADLTFTLPVAPTVDNQALISTTAGVMAFTPYTFPTSDGTASQVLQTNGSGVLSFSTPSGGKVLQVVQTVKTDTFSSTTGSFTDVTGLSVSITPSSASNKILVLSDIHYATNSDAGFAFFKLVRASTDIYLGDTAGSRIRASAGGASGSSTTTEQASIIFLDSPSTTSATTYKIQVYNQNTSHAIFVNRTFTDTDNTSYLRTASSITVMEIAP
jgi:hypothetical protein